LADKRLQYLELLKLDGPVEVNFVSIEDEDLFFAMPFGQISSFITWRPDSLGWMNVPPQPTDKSDMVLLSNEWWVELRRSFDSTMQSIVQYQLFESGFLRLLIVPVPSEDVMRALIVTNLPVVLTHLDSGTTIGKIGANLLSQCMIFPTSGEYPATLDDITYGCDEKHSINPPDQYFCMSMTNPMPKMFDLLRHLPGKNVTPYQKLVPAEVSKNPAFTNDVKGKTVPLPVLLRQASSPSESQPSSHLFPHQKRTVGWMVDIENGISPPLFCPLANLFGGYYVFSYGMERAMIHKRVEVLQPKNGCLAGGGMIAHPVGSGKTIIAIELVNHTYSLGPTVICVPDHIVLQWYQEFYRFAPNISTQVYTRHRHQIPPSTDCLIVGHGDVVIVLPNIESYYRLIIDEPQEIVKCDKIFNCLINFTCKQRWLLTATPQPLDLMMQLALGYEHNPKLPLRAMEAWFVQTRCRRDPPTLCMPIPPMYIYMKPVTLLWQETSVMHSYAMQDDLQAAIRLASFFHTKKARFTSSANALVPGLEKAKKFHSLTQWVRERSTELETHLLEHKANVERISQIISKAANDGKVSMKKHSYKPAVEEESENGIEVVDPLAMQQLYEQYPGVPEELLLERERSTRYVNKTRQLLTFMDTIVETVTADSECLICMNKLGGRVVSMLPCLHSCCATCIVDMFRHTKTAKLQCPLCRHTVMRHMICTFLCAASNDEQLTKEASSLNLLGDKIRYKFGSKIFAIVSEILEILRKNVDDKIVVFAQWADLLEQISVAIPAEVKHCLLYGSMEARCRMIEDFRLNPLLRVMLLSSESQASG